MPYLTKQFKFCAAHKYWNNKWDKDKNYQVFGDDIKVHGHNYTLEVMVTGEVDDETGFIVDLGHLKKIVNKYVIDVLDHTQFEKEVEWFKDKQPSSENLAQFIWLQIEPSLKGAKLYRIRLKETPTIFTDYYGK